MAGDLYTSVDHAAYALGWKYSTIFLG